MFCLVIFMIFIFDYETKVVTASHDKLDFWVGYSPENARRTNAHKIIENTTSPSRKVPFRSNPLRGTNEKEKKNEKRKKYTNLTRLGAGERVRPSTRTGVRSNKYFQRAQSVSENTHWPKVQKPRFRQRVEERSTRMTPIYLMQQDDDAESTTAKKEDDENVNLDLNSYSIKDDMLNLADEFPEANITVEVIGRTAEYKDLVLMKVSERKSDLTKYFRADESKYIDEVPEKKIVLIVHGLSVMGLQFVPCLNLMKPFKTLVSYYFANLDKFDIYLIPMANPDGYSVVTKTYHIWDKNMSPQSACPGVALDRNFDVRFNLSHTISSCSQHFPGATPFSEPETRAIREVLHHYSQKIVAYFHVHAGSYYHNIYKGEAVLYPKGYTEVQSDDDKYIDLRGEIDEAMKNASFQVITVAVDTLHNWYGKVTGSSVDYAASVYGVPYALEIVMQPYAEGERYSKASAQAVSPNRMSALTLEEIWRRVINVIFNNIWRNVKNNDI